MHFFYPDIFLVYYRRQSIIRLYLHRDIIIVVMHFYFNFFLSSAPHYLVTDGDGIRILTWNSAAHCKVEK